MPRPRRFEEADVLAALADVFSRHGYEGTSLAMLSAATGLGKQSLYNAFGDKRRLYEQAVESSAKRYGDSMAAVRVARTGRDGIALFFADLKARCVCDGPQRHCIVSQGLLEGIPDESIAMRLRSKWSGTRELLRETIERGQRDGSIANATTSGTLADMLMSLTSGFRVMAQVESDPQRLATAIAAGLSVLDAATVSDESSNKSGDEPTPL